MSEHDYDSYLMRAEFTNFTGRTLDGVHGLMFCKNPIIKVPKNLEQYLSNVDGKGKNFVQFVSDVCYETLKTGWGGIFLDAPVVEGAISKKDAEELGIYPYLSFYTAESLYNWHYGEKGRIKKLDRVCLHEITEVSTSDPFEFYEKDRYRMLFLDENNQYHQIVEVDGAITSDIIPTKSGKAFNSIQFWTTPSDEPEKPFLMDLVNTNLSWYRKSADLENGLHHTGVPTPYILGYEPETKYNEVTGEEIPAEPIYLGGSKVLTIPSGSQFSYLEYSGSGLSQLSNAMENDEERMAILGARIISSEKKGVEAVDTARIHRAGENSVLATFANNMSIILKDVLRKYLEWITETDIDEDDIDVKINTDYDVSRMSTAEIQALVSAWQSGGISKKILFNNLQEGEIINPDVTFDDMENDIDDEKENTQTSFASTPTQENNQNVDDSEKEDKEKEEDEEEV